MLNILNLNYQQDGYFQLAEVLPLIFPSNILPISFGWHNASWSMFGLAAYQADTPAGWKDMVKYEVQWGSCVG